MKTNKFALLTLILLGLFSLNISAQKTETTTNNSGKNCTGEKFVMPPSISVNNEIFADYLKVASLPNKERKELFSKQTDEQKANFIKVNLALQIVKRPNLTKDQKEFILDGISKVSADIYDRSSPEKIEQNNQIGLEIEAKSLGLFEHKDLGDFIEPLMMSKDVEVRLLQKYENLLKSGSKERMQIVREMPISDRVNIWKVQLAYHLITGKFSNPQTQFILDQLSSLSSETYINNANLSEEEIVKSAKTKIDKILDVFNKAEAFAIFMTIGIQKYVEDKVVNSTDLAPTTCNCNWSCPGSQYCGGPNGCMSSKIGDCGPFGLTRCNYLCVN
jgi:hypothetical protein